jgi:hemerythrin-like domain-containing protein
MRIKDFMTNHHRECDHLLANVEDAVNRKDFDAALIQYQLFKNETLKHFGMEEEYLFPLFEEKTGMTSGPTQVMRMEHSQARTLFEKLDEVLEKKQDERFFSLSDSLMILLQQHNAKEEQMLYTMMQRVLDGENDSIVQRLGNYNV